MYILLLCAGHQFCERQPDAMLPAWTFSDAETEQEEHDYALSHHLLKDNEQAEYFRDNDMFATPWNSVFLPMKLP